ncbi:MULTISPECIES: hypothetical protein [unclassified Moorena]|uniref:hypothetical protein n=1 Tax=unclassified Moorena TaxID=2683338 RepID=UPI0013C0B867|nr:MULTISPECIES: hypothetical protein [unclassified Moorena]NEP30023.1 hypothetical protein [Moorena sp. SIO3B2]NET64632.1 hypothetical protein [Moorena sp. SIO1G6]
MNLTDALPTLHLFPTVPDSIIKQRPRLPIPDSRLPTPDFCNKSNQLLPRLSGR